MTVELLTVREIVDRLNAEQQYHPPVKLECVRYLLRSRGIDPAGHVAVGRRFQVGYSPEAVDLVRDQLHARHAIKSSISRNAGGAAA